MSHFVKIEEESVWINVERLDVIAIRPQLQAIGTAGGQGSLEELHEATGHYEVIVSFQERLIPVRVFATQAEAEGFVTNLLGQLAP